tara:strand:+ start:882 stop:1226 length:345 start_codon:yes stop_codon:yes gene_type:complete
MTVIALATIIFAVIAARPSTTIRITAHENGSFTCETRTYRARELKAAVSDAVARRKRWFMTPKTQINFEAGVKFTQVPQVMSLVASAGCKDVQVGLPPELSSKLSRPGLTSEPW